MAVVPRQRKQNVVYYVANKQAGRLVWERVGTDKRAAERRDKAMRKEIAAGTYTGKPTGAATVRAFAEGWFANRDNRSAKTEKAWWTNHVLARASWYADLKLEDVRVADTVRLTKELEKPYVVDGVEKTLSDKSVHNIISLLSTMFRDARIAELMVRNVCELPRGTINKKPTVRRTPYSARDVVALTTDERVLPDARVMLALLFYTGAREGEACGLKWSDWDRSPSPLGSLLIERQYDNQPLKTEKKIGEASRVVPVHPTLASMLDAWQREGFEFVYTRAPKPSDFIVPCRARHRNGKPYAGRFLSNHTRSSAYKMFQKAIAAVEIESQSLHATRHTFISLARRGGARRDVLERVTHNARGAMIDVYTQFDWAPLCEAVSCFLPASK